MKHVAGKHVTVFDYPDERFKIQYEGRELPYSVFDRQESNPSGRHRQQQAARRCFRWRVSALLHLR